ncbi:MAG: GNAT family N-acetyltransferase [Opitutales bacterium]
MELSYAGIDTELWNRKELSRLLKKFPEGQVAIEVNGKAVGCALAIIVDYSRFGDTHTYDQITANDTFTTHDPDGDVLYGIEVFVHPEYRGMRLARRLYEARKELCDALNLRGIILGGRIPGYRNHREELSPREYIQKVEMRELYDPILTFQLANGFHVRKVLKAYLEGDSHSGEYATLLEWNNIYYEEKPQLLNAPKSEIRLGLVQWGMRPSDKLETVLDQAEYFIDTVSDYQSDFILFPEFFSAPLMVGFNHLSEPEAMRKLAEFTRPILEQMQNWAVAYNINIIAGSLPVVDGDHLYNEATLLRRDGSSDSIRKIHITPSEQEAQGVMGGERIRTLQTDCGPIGILICYDCEFPELSRLLRDEGMRILFVPYMTDMQTGYNRVRICSQARAIENEVYVAIAGSVGNLPRVNNMDIQFSQSAVFSPSDFSFPSNGVVAEATPNTEMVLMADVNLDLLRELHESGAVRNIKDRRMDLYRLAWRETSDGKSA